MERDFEAGGRKFKLCKLDPFKQFHIARRIGPVMSELLPAMGEIVKLQKAGSFETLPESDKLDQLAKLFSPIMVGLAKLSDADADHVLYGLLAGVEVQQQPVGNWARVAKDSLLMMSDLDLPVLLQAAGRSFAFNLGGFIGALPQSS